MLTPAALPRDRFSVRLDDVELLPKLRRVFQNGIEIKLTCAEFDILGRFFQTPGEIVSREELCRIALERDLNPFDRSFVNLVASLRRKLSYGAGGSARIRSARGRGYFYSPHEGSAPNEGEAT